MLAGRHTRNKTIFEPDIQIGNPVASCIAKAAEFYHLGLNHHQKPNKSPVILSGKPPNEGDFKLNTDGAAKGNPGPAGAGGIIRNHRGFWVKGFSRKVGLATNIIAELWALRDGLKLAQGLGIHKLEVELDAQVAIILTILKFRHGSASLCSYSS